MAALWSRAAIETSKNQPARDFWRRSIFDFATLSAQSGRPAGCEVAQELGAVARFRAGQVDCLGKQLERNGSRYSVGRHTGVAPRTATGAHQPQLCK